MDFLFVQYLPDTDHSFEEVVDLISHRGTCINYSAESDREKVREAIWKKLEPAINFKPTPKKKSCDIM
jgi:hypothetical protein